MTFNSFPFFQGSSPFSFLVFFSQRPFVTGTENSVGEYAEAQPSNEGCSAVWLALLASAHLRPSHSGWWFQPIRQIMKNISQIGNLPQIGMTIKNIWNHHLALNWLIDLIDHLAWGIYKNIIYTPPKFNMNHWKWWVSKRELPFCWDFFSGSMFNFRGVVLQGWFFGLDCWKQS